MKKTFFLNQIFLLSGVVFFVTLLTLVFVGNSIRKTHIERVKKELIEFSAALSLQVKTFLVEDKSESIEDLLSTLNRSTDMRITVFSFDELVIADSELAREELGNINASLDVQAALNGEIGTTLSKKVPRLMQNIFVSVPIEDEGKIVGALRAGKTIGELDKLLDTVRRRILYTGLIVFLFSVGIAYLLSLRFSTPVRQLSDAAKRLANGYLHSKVFLKKRDQLKELADNYNTMTEKVLLFMEDISCQKEELNSIISAIHPGLLVLDREGRIKLHNESMEAIVRKKDLQGQFYWQVLKEPELFDHIQYVQEKKKNRKDELQIEGNYYRITIDHLAPLNETVIVFHDITDIKNIENIKRDLVVNVSHELRTPLTAIKGYTETIEGIDEENNHYLEIVKRHTDRLIKIVEDLLILNELEESGTRVEKECVDLKKLVGQVVNMFDGRLSDKKLKLRIEADEQLPTVQGDFLKLEQVFINLIDNAVKYTEEGEIKIKLSYEERFVRAEVQDTGVGIPADHIPRIFERFYTVNKSRSRQLGGTSLGLSIVRHIVNLHGGDVELRSATGVGTTFIVKLPLYE
jgi:two-component system phosphate regulon sensor histidine kinase PhoR